MMPAHSSRFRAPPKATPFVARRWTACSTWPRAAFVSCWATRRPRSRAMTSPRPDRSVVLATGNAGKLAEMRSLLAPLRITIRARSEFALSSPAETGLTFVENALLKARHAAQHTGLAAIADDSGIAVDAL